MMSTKEISAIAQNRFAAYEAGSASAVLGLYAEDCQYWDTRSGGRLSGRAALAEHVGRLLGRFDMRFALLEEHRLEGRDATILLWECAVRRRLPDGKPGDALLMQRGMNLIEINDGLIARDESYMDLAALDQLVNLPLAA